MNRWSSRTVHRTRPGHRSWLGHSSSVGEALKFQWLGRSWPLSRTTSRGFSLIDADRDGTQRWRVPSHDDSNVPGVLGHCRRFSGDSERPFGGRLLSVRLRPCLDGRQGRSVRGNSCDAATDATPDATDATSEQIENSVRIEWLDVLPRRTWSRRLTRVLAVRSSAASKSR
jgi:hypothetical protein